MSASVKGTTRVSSNDRKLMKDLWVASKDNPLEKNRQKRKLTQNEKQTRDDMPEERGKAGFKSLLKKQKTFDGHFESRKGDDMVAVQTIQQQGWSDFCLRQTAHCSAVREIQLFRKLLKTRQKRAGAEVQYKHTVDWIAPNLFYHNEDADDTKMFHFLGDFKNKRFANYRQRCDAYTQKAQKFVTDVTLGKMGRIVNKEDHFTKTVELEFSTDYEATKHQRVFLKCDQCGKDVCAKIAIHQENRLFLHPECRKTATDQSQSSQKRFKFEIFAQMARN